MTLSIANAFADSERTIQVQFSTAPLAASSIGPGDALNPQSYSLQRNDNLFNYVVMAVKQIDSMTFQLYLLQKLSSYLVIQTLDASKVVDPSSSPIVNPTTWPVNGCQAANPAPIQQGQVDLANLPTSDQSVAGTLVVSSAGDYVTQGGNDLLKKLVIRRITTTPGEFFYMSNYGLGVKVKSSISSSDLSTLKKKIQQQILQEPEFSAAKVSLTLNNDNSLICQLVLTLAKTNQQIPLQITATP